MSYWNDWYNKQPPMDDGDLWYHLGLFRVNEQAKPGECLFKDYEYSPSEHGKRCDICIIPKMYGKCAAKPEEHGWFPK